MIVPFEENRAPCSRTASNWNHAFRENNIKLRGDAVLCQAQLDHLGAMRSMDAKHDEVLSCLESDRKILEFCISVC